MKQEYVYGTLIYHELTMLNRKEFNMTRKRVWVSPDGDGGWNVKTQGAKRAAANFEDKLDAVDRAKDIAKNAPLGQVVIQKRDGEIQTEHTYGKDPKKYPG